MPWLATIFFHDLSTSCSQCFHGLFMTSLQKAGAELCQAQTKLEVVVEFGGDVEACHY